MPSKCGMKLPIHSRTSTVAPLKMRECWDLDIRINYWIELNWIELNWIDLIPHIIMHGYWSTLWLKLIHVSKSGPSSPYY